MSDESKREEMAARRRLRALRARHHQLVKEYSELKERVREYTERRWISEGEDLEKKALQRAKLQRKDTLVLLQRELDALERSLDSDPSTPQG